MQSWLALYRAQIRMTLLHSSLMSGTSAQWCTTMTRSTRTVRIQAAHRAPRQSRSRPKRGTSPVMPLTHRIPTRPLIYRKSCCTVDRCRPPPTPGKALCADAPSPENPPVTRKGGRRPQTAVRLVVVVIRLFVCWRS